MTENDNLLANLEMYPIPIVAENLSVHSPSPDQRRIKVLFVTGNCAGNPEAFPSIFYTPYSFDLSVYRINDQE